MSTGNDIFRVHGVPFGPSTKFPQLADMAECLICGAQVDVGGELRDHASWHLAERMEDSGG